MAVIGPGRAVDAVLPSLHLLQRLAGLAAPQQAHSSNPYIFTSVSDLDQLDPHVLGLPDPDREVWIRIHLSSSKNSEKNFDFDFLYLKNDVNVV